MNMLEFLPPPSSPDNEPPDLQDIGLFERGLELLRDAFPDQQECCWETLGADEESNDEL